MTQKRQMDDNIDDLGRRPDGSKHDQPGAVERAKEDSDAIAERAAEVSRKVGLQRPFKKDSDDTVTGGFNQKHR